MSHARLCLLILLTALASCGKSRQPLASRTALEQGEYALAFDATKDELRRLGFTLDRIDARAGVITTEPRSSAGFATPWEQQETTSRQELENLLQRQRRRVEVRFVADSGNQSPPDDLRQWAGPMHVDVRVGVERIYRFGLRVQPISVRMSSVARDPELMEIGAQPGIATPSGGDDFLAGRIASRIARRVDSGRSEVQPADQPGQ
jgi:hypothetical protein